MGLCPLFLFQPSMQGPLEHIRAIAERVARSRGLEVWDIQSRRETVGHVVRVFIDRPGRRRLRMTA